MVQRPVDSFDLVALLGYHESRWLPAISAPYALAVYDSFVALTYITRQDGGR